MRAIQITEQGDADVLKLSNDVPEPTALQGTLVVKNVVSGINYIDTYHRSGLYSVALPFVPGVDGAGEVVAVGEGVSGFSVGDRVAYFGSGGSYAELTRVDAATTAHIPAGVSYEAAAAGMVQGLTAQALATLAYDIQPGDWVLVHAAAGGTGQLLTQIAKKRGGRVIGTVSTPEKAELAKELGAEAVILYTQQDVVQRVKEITGGRGVAVAYDGVGAATWDTSRRSLAPRGALVLFGNASGKVDPVDIFTLTPGNIRLQRPSLFEFLKEGTHVFQALSRDVLGAIAAGDLKVRIAGEWPLAQAADAHRALTSRATTGKLLLRP
eukprot:CAMPEP_0202861396 /NCGR_PEP_ID=MMETSP1391-20130828/2813_1 /ASSEMBLY_ACC=CAM_ASM_000867 /TAXON_ID=1034604 /ORGANISM="Chlamydomonas leiostraca, Strain SAG 11-49" /LENGTH=323 /DNA_ID=CAMNT_0049540783 /DNA_START=128 /DNA_END=1099 /DNA_ORIENTATION=-